MEKEEYFIDLRKRDILKFGIRDENGIATGEYIEFDLEDIELSIRYNDVVKMHYSNLKNLKGELQLIDKCIDKRGKYPLSLKQEKEVIALNKFYTKEMEALDLFLGENGSKKMLNGRKPYLSMFDDITKSIEPILPIIQKKAKSLEDLIMTKYSNNGSDILEK